MRIRTITNRKRFNWQSSLGLFFFTSLFVLLLHPVNSEAVHKGAGDLTCGGCHTMHNSQGSGETNLGGATPNGSLVLLRGNVTGRNEIHNLCFQCHAENGSQGGNIQAPHSTTAPKVYKTTPWTANDFSTIGAGGDFSNTGSYAGGIWTLASADDCSDPSLGRGHSLGCTNVLPPGSAEVAITDFSCTSCHDPHGSKVEMTDASVQGVNKYRNLRVMPVGAGGAMATETTGVIVTARSYVGGISDTIDGNTGTNFIGNSGNETSANHFWPVIRDETNQNAYYAGTDNTEAQISGWCAQCHDKWHEDGAGTSNQNSDDWQRHPVNNVLDEAASPNSGAGVKIFDSTAYGAPTLVSKLPAAQSVQPTGGNGTGDNVFYANDTSVDKIFCLSCHMVHGGPYYDNLRWDYTSSVVSSNQTGKGIPTGVGCQICHNR